MKTYTKKAESKATKEARHDFKFAVLVKEKGKETSLSSAKMTKKTKGEINYMTGRSFGKWAFREIPQVGTMTRKSK